MAASWSLRVSKVGGPGPVGVGTAFPLSGEVIVGRSEGADLVLRDPTISSRHARLAVREDGLWVEALGSGAVYLGGSRITGAAQVGGGAWLQLGAILFQVHARTSRAVLTVDLESERAWLGGRLLALRPAEYRLVRALAENPGTWLVPEDLVQAIWANDPAFGNVGYVDKYVSYVRKAMREALDNDAELLAAVQDAVSAAADEGRAPDDVAGLTRTLIKARKKVGFRLQLSGDRVAVVR